MSIIGNPFVECTSRDMSYQEVFNYWCNPFNCYSIDEYALKNSTTPIIIEGARGSGKTMILKYISYYFQKEAYERNCRNHSVPFFEYLTKMGYIGVYFRYKDDFDVLFNTLNCSHHSKEHLFSYYFELYIILEIINILRDIEDHEQNASSWKKLTSSLSVLFAHECQSLFECAEYICEKIQEIDNWVRRSRYIEQAENKLSSLLHNSYTIKEICEIIQRDIFQFHNTKFLIIIDEYENAGKYQTIINTFIKQVDHTSNLSYRIGVRPKGIISYETKIGSEFLQADRDYLLFPFNIKSMSSYKEFIKNVAKQRLLKNEFFSSLNLVDISKILGTRENMDSEALGVAKSRTKHFEPLKKKYADYNSIVESLRNPDKPLMEMLNILWALRGIDPQCIKSAMISFEKGDYKYSDTELVQKYKLDYTDKYRYQLLLVLLGIYGQPKKYYSFNTFAYLSSGVVNDFISLCRNTFYLLDESYYNTAYNSPCIPIATQAKGAENTAIEQMDKIKLCKDHGMEMYTFAMNLGNYFKMLGKDIMSKYPETNQFAFENEIDIEQRPLLQEVYSALIKWGVIIRKPRIQSISIGKRKGVLYCLNRVLCPIFSIPYRTRGGYNFIISSNLFETMLYESMEAKQIEDKNKKIKQMDTKPTTPPKVSGQQISIFEVLVNEQE